MDLSKYQGYDWGFSQKNPTATTTNTTGNTGTTDTTGTGGTTGTTGKNTGYYNSPDVTGQFASPAGWTQAQDYWTKMLGGGGLAGGGVDWSGPNAQATDIKGWWESQKPIYQTQSEDAIKQAMEQMGFNLGEGMRWSTPAQYQVGDIQQRSMQDLMGQVMGAQMSMEEANKQRALQAALTSGQLGTEASIANMGARNAAAGNLFGAGSAENNFALQLAQMLSGFGQQTENPSWMQNAMQTSPQGATGLPKSYEQNFWDQLGGADFSGLMDLFGNKSGIPKGFGGGGVGVGAGGSAGF